MEINDLAEDYLNILLKSFGFLEYCNILFCDENMSKFRRNYPLFYKIPCMIIYYVTLTLYIIKIFEGEMEFVEIVQVASVYVICFQTLYRAVVIFSKKKHIKTIILRLGHIWRTANLSEEQIMKKNALLKRLNFRYAVFDWLVFIGAWQYMLLPFLETIFRIYILQQEHPMLLPFKCIYPFDPTKDWLTYLAVYVLQVYSMLHIVYCYTGSEMVLMALTSHLSTEFSLLQHDYIDFDPDNSDENDNGIYSERNEDQHMEDFIQRHQKIIRIAKDLGDFYNGIVFLNLTCATIMIGFFGVSIIVSKGALEVLKHFIAMFSGTYPIYNVCFHAELLKEASLGVGDAAYQNLWYKGSLKHQKIILLIIKRSQTPCYLSSLKSKIALKTFMSVLKTSWSYFSLALSVNEDK